MADTRLIDFSELVEPPLASVAYVDDGSAEGKFPFDKMPFLTVFNVKTYGATGDGSTDDTADIQSAIDVATGSILFFPEGVYITTQLNLVDDITLTGVGEGSILKQKDSNNGKTLAIVGKNNISIENLAFDGNESNNTSGVSGAIALEGNTSGFILQNCHLFDHRHSAFIVSDPATTSRGVKILNNYFDNTGVGSGGGHAILMNWKAPGSIITGNRIDTTGASANGIWLGNDSDYAIISNNHLENIGRMGIEVFTNAKGGVSVTGNTIDDNGGFGISIAGSDHTTVIGNVIRDGSGLGIEIAVSDNCTVTGNVVIDLAGLYENGIVVNNASGCTVTGNVLFDIGNGSLDAAIRVFDDAFTASPSDFNIIANNYIRLPDSTTDVDGIQLLNNHATASISHTLVTGNVIAGNGSTTTNGIVITDSGSGTTENNTFTNNIIKDVAVGISIGSSVDAGTLLRDNVFVGNTTDITDSGGLAIINEESGGMGVDIASSSTIAVGRGKIFKLTGTTTVTTITASWAGREIMLIDTSTASITDGSNLKLAGSLTGAADTTITLVCDGTDWFEISRSVN